jgi:glycosyltransferase involved in cell wall biosynthesis
MKYVLNFYNQVAAGPVNLTRTFLSTLSDREETNDKFLIILPDLFSYRGLKLKDEKNLKIIYIPYFRGVIKISFLFLYDFIIFPLLVLIVNPFAVLIFGNLAPIPFFSKKIVLVHHSYLVDDDLLSGLNFRKKVMELAKRFVFFLTTKTTKIFVVESFFMKDKLIKKYKPSKKSIYVIKNSVDRLLYDHESKKKENILHREKNSVLYVSRYAPHKNHRFLLDLAYNHRDYFRKNNIKFYVTVDVNISEEAYKYIEDIKSKRIEDLVVNLGEVPNKKLKSYYNNSLCLFFPSKSETFGIPLVESMAFGLPIIAPNLPYARSVCDDAALYYVHDDIDDAFRKICSIYNDKKNGKIFNPYNVEELVKLLKNIKRKLSAIKSSRDEISREARKKLNINKSGDDFISAINSLL